MEKFYLTGSAKTPTINLNGEIGVLEFKRRSIPENSVVINWYFNKNDEDMAEAGEYYGAIISLPFKFIEFDEISQC